MRCPFTKLAVQITLSHLMKLYLFTAFLFLSYVANAQSNFKNGYLVNLQGDTICGLIDYKEWDRNPTSIDFKTSSKERSRSYILAELLSFSITDFVKYEKYNVSISTNKIDISSPPPLSDTVSSTSIVLLKEILAGQNITLYAYRDNVKERFYIRD